MRAFWRLLISYNKSYLRDRMSVFFTLLMPVLFMGLFGLIFSSEDASKFDIGLVLEDTSPGGDMIEQAFSSVEVFVVHRGSRQEELEALEGGERRAVVIIPAGLSQNLATAQPSEVQVYFDPSQMVTAQTVLSIVRQVLAEINKGVTGRPDLLVANETSIQTQRLRAIDYLVPGILAMAIMQLGLFSLAGMVANRQNLVLKRLGATPLPRHLLISSQTTVTTSSLG